MNVCGLDRNQSLLDRETPSMDDVSELSDGIRLTSRSDAQTRQSWDEDSGFWEESFWEDPVTIQALAELTLAEAKKAEEAVRREQSTLGGPPPTNQLRGDGRNGGRVASRIVRMTPTITPRPSQPPLSQGTDAPCLAVT